MMNSTEPAMPNSVPQATVQMAIVCCMYAYMCCAVYAVDVEYSALVTHVVTGDHDEFHYDFNECGNTTAVHTMVTQCMSNGWNLNDVRVEVFNEFNDKVCDYLLNHRTNQCVRFEGRKCDKSLAGIMDLIKAYDWADDMPFIGLGNPFAYDETLATLRRDDKGRSVWMVADYCPDDPDNPFKEVDETTDDPCVYFDVTDLSAAARSTMRKARLATV